MKRRLLRTGLVFGAFVAAFMLTMSPLAAALTYSLTAPYAHAYAADKEWETELTGSFLQFNVDPGPCTGVYTPVWAQASTGTGGLHYEVQAIPNYEECGNDAQILFYGNAFTPSVSGYYTTTSTWSLSPDPGTGYFIVSGVAVGQITANLIIHVKIYDATAGVWLTPYDGTVLSQSGLFILWQWYSTQYYSAPNSGAYLVAGHTYQMWNMFEAKIVADSASLPGNTIGELLTRIANPSFTAYIYTGGGGGCMLSGTPVLLANGKTTLPIDKLGEGDQVLGYNVTTGQLVPVTVVSNTYSHVPEVMNINNGTLVVTPTDQPLYARNATWQGWLRNPEELQTGWQLFSPATRSWVTVTSVMMQSGNLKVYDLKTSLVNDFIANGILADMK